jgi:hypothetical protein
MIFVFTCKNHPTTHEPHERERSKTSAGTSNLKNTAQKCDKEQGIVAPLAPTATYATAYSAAAHRAIIALRCATDHRPFNSVADKYYKMEVELLRPGTKIPAPTTVSLDIKHLYLELSKGVREYFKVCIKYVSLHIIDHVFRFEIDLYT